LADAEIVAAGAADLHMRAAAEGRRARGGRLRLDRHRAAIAEEIARDIAGVPGITDRVPGIAIAAERPAEHRDVVALGDDEDDRGPDARAIAHAGAIAAGAGDRRVIAAAGGHGAGGDGGDIPGEDEEGRGDQAMRAVGVNLVPKVPVCVVIWATQDRD